MLTSIQILTERRAQLVTELEYQQGSEERLLAALADLPGIISGVESAIAEIDIALAKISA